MENVTSRQQIDIKLSISHTINCRLTDNIHSIKYQIDKNGRMIYSHQACNINKMKCIRLD